ncbi:TOBE domain-containing protein [Streptomyces sp. NPDC019990]|uniref:TOBE domain-containing protein n=1 Tax=Streptomyces sp. NPDC019990 TaxID=3154693 RepID=UPI003402B811
MDTHVHDRRCSLALAAGTAAAPRLTALPGVVPERGARSDGGVVEVTVRLGAGERRVSLVAPRADAARLRPDDPVRLTVRPENLLLFEADRPERPGRRIETHS